MRQALLLLWSALTASVQGEIQVTTNLAANAETATTSRLIPVLVGGSQLSFTPNSVTARPGDVIQFQFAARNHSVTQSTQSSPCTPVDANSTAVNGVHSGFILFDGGASGMVGTFDVPVKDTNPMYLYCAQASHCQSGMVMVINGDSNSLISYANAAASAKTNTPAKLISGGVVAAIPIADSVVSASSGSNGGGGGGGGGGQQSPQQSNSGSGTRTVTGPGRTATATAVVTARPTRTNGGGTATAFATVVVGPSGLATPSASAAAAVQGGSGGAPSVIPGSGNPQAAVAPASGAAGLRAGVGGSLLVAAGAGMLGTLLLTVRL